MFETVLLLAQIAMVAGPAAWLTLGAWDNLVHPKNNEAFTAEVMGMTRMAATYPDEFKRVAHRAVTDRSWQLLAFRLVVFVEMAAVFVMWAGVAALILAMSGVGLLSTAKAVALGGVLLFTSVWVGFLVVGNYFCYWFCHEWAQNTHFQMTVWGLLTMIFLVVA